MNQYRLLIRLLFLVLLPGLSTAQGYRLRLRKAPDNRLVIELRTIEGGLPGREDRILDIVFGIKWSRGDAAVLGNQVESRFNVRKAGAPQRLDGISFQAFCVDPVGFGFPAMIANEPWVEVMRIDVCVNAADSAVFELCEPGFGATAEPNIRINEKDHTPALEGKAEWSSMEAAPAPDETGFSIQPNPATGFVQLAFKGSETGGTCRYTLLDGKGAIVRTDLFSCYSRLTLDIHSLPKGVYYVVVDRHRQTLCRESFVKL